MLKKNQLPAFPESGSDWRFTVEAIDKWRASGRVGAPTPDAEHQQLSSK